MVNVTGNFLFGLIAPAQNKFRKDCSTFQNPANIFIAEPKSVYFPSQFPVNNYKPSQ